MALPVVSGRRAIKALTKAGFRVAGRKGSHIKLKKKVNDRVFVVIVPDHGVGERNIEIDIEASEHYKRRVSKITSRSLSIEDFGF